MSLVSCTSRIGEWLKVINIQNLTRCVKAIKYIYINLNIGCNNETIKFIITTKFLGAQVDNNLT